jgi:hypothetical protein
MAAMDTTKTVMAGSAGVLLLLCLYFGSYFLLSYPQGLVDYGPFKGRSYGSKATALLFQPAAAIESQLTRQKVQVGWPADEGSHH